MKTGIVIFFCGAAGSGKTTLVSKLVDRLKNVETLSFDAYIHSSTCPPEYFEGTVTDPNLIISQRFIDDVHSLSHGRSIIDPLGNLKEPKQIDENFGRLRNTVAPLIDYLIYIDLPLDILLVRRILRNISQDLNDYDSSQILDIIKSNLSMYLGGFRDTFIYIASNLPKQSDLILDGMKSLDEISEEANQAIQEFVCRFDEGGNIS